MASLNVSHGQRMDKALHREDGTFDAYINHFNPDLNVDKGHS